MLSSRRSAPKGLATRLIRASVSMVALAVFVSGSALIFMAGRTQRDNVFELQRQYARRASRLISDYMARARDRLIFFLENEPLIPLSPRRRKAALEKLMIASLPLYSQVSLLDGTGREVAKVSRFHTFLPGELASQASSRAFAEAVRGETHVGPVAFLGNTGLLTVPMAMPARAPSGKVEGVVVAEVDAGRLWRDVGRIEIGRTGYAYLVDTRGRFVAYQKPAEVLQRYGEDMSRIPPVSEFLAGGGEAVGRVREYRGLFRDEVVGVCAAVQGTDWAVVVEQPVREAYAGTRRMQGYFLGLLALGALLAGCVTFFVARRLVHPIRALTEAARRLGSGDMETELVDVQGQDEVGVLSQAFKSMQKELRESYARLEGKVEELEAMQGALRESEERFRTLVEESPLGISLIGKDGRYLYVNPRFRDMFGYGLEDVPAGSRWLEKAFPDEAYRKTVLETWKEDRQRDRAGQGKPRVFTVTCADGSQRVVHFRAVTMKNLDHFVIHEDVTEKHEMELELQQARKFEAIGTLAGGIAHDFNNLLMGIQGRASLMRVNSDPASPRMEHLLAIEDYVRSASELTGQLLGFARGGKYVVKPVDVGELATASASMFGRTKKEILIRTKTPSSPLVVEADRGQLEQVLLNLYINAWQAMPDGGTLSLDVGAATPDRAFLELHGLPPGPYARISVADTGTGMDEATRARIFDPFFTTKEKGRGTGLGLASAYGIVKNHGGAVTVSSEVGRGTVFDIYLPLSDKEAHAEASAEKGPVKGSEAILLVDDEEMIVEVAQAMLETLGYEVVAVRSGREAVDALAGGGRFDLVILDLIMPGMDGSQTFDRIRQIRPDIPVMLSSGYAVDGQAESVMRRGCNGFIQKPFDIVELSERVRQVLDNSSQ